MINRTCQPKHVTNRQSADVKPTQTDIDAQFTAFGQALRHARDEVNGWTRRELERVTGISTSTIVRAERGERARLETYLQLSSALGVDIPADVMEALVAVEGPIADSLTTAAPPAWFTEYAAAAEERERLRHEEVTAMLRRALTALDAAI